ncbi:Rgp1-domain-containing protein, partial [Phlyctochytrium arcticum]
MGVVLAVKLGESTNFSEGAFFAGELFTCSLTFTNLATQAGDASISNGSRASSSDTLAKDFESQHGSETPSDSAGQLVNLQSYPDTIHNPENGNGAHPSDPIDQSYRTNTPGKSSHQLDSPIFPINTSTNSSSSISGPKSADAAHAVEANTGFSRFLRKSISFSTIRNAVDSTLSFLGTSDSSNTAGQRQIRGRAGPIGVTRNHDYEVAKRSAGAVESSKSQARLNSDSVSPNASVHGGAPSAVSPTTEKRPGWGSRQHALRSATKQSLIRPPSAQTVTWAYAQMIGQFTIDPAFVKPNEFEVLNKQVMYRAVGGPAAGSGGGGMLGSQSSSATGGKDSTDFPVYSTPPSIIFTNLKLEPGESKSFKYKMELPKELPPSHRGKAIRLSYKLIVGVQRGGIHQKSQIYQLPFRVFSYIHGDGSRPSYDLKKPIVVRRDTAMIETVDQDDDVLVPRWSKSGTLEVSQSAKSKHATIKFASDSEEFTDCLSRTMNFSQMSRKVSFDICKNNEHVAKFTLAKSVFRLGEKVLGILDFSAGALPCYRVSAFLESNEHIEDTYAVRSNDLSSRLTRRVHYEQHIYTLSTKRQSIDLYVPVNHSPDFHTSAGECQPSL